MILKAFTVGTKAYGKELNDRTSADDRFLNDDQFMADCNRRSSNLKDFFEIMALCHTISAEI